MRKLSRFGAAALAMALSLTMVAPIGAKAYYYDDFDDGDYGSYYDYDEKGSYDANGVWNETGYTYKNRVSGDTYTYDNATGASTGDLHKATNSFFGNPKKIQVDLKNITQIVIKGNPGEAFDGKIKIKSGKGNVTIKQIGKHEEEILPSFDGDAKQYFFMKNDGSKEYIGATVTDVYAVKRTQVSYAYAVFGKKTGSAKIVYTIAGKKQKATINVVEDNRPFKSVTFAGKSYQQDYNTGATNGNYYVKQSANKGGNWYTTKKAGKFKVTMNKNYKFIATYVIKPTDYEPTSDTGDYYSETGLARKATKGIDLNGDGDFEDTINGIREKDYAYSTYTKIGKKNAKIKLSTSFGREDSKFTFYNEDKTKSRTGSKSYTGYSASTQVIVVYQNKLTKAYGTDEFYIHYQKPSKK